MNAKKPTLFDNVFVLGVDPPAYLEDVVPHVYAGPYNELDWWTLLPGREPPEHHDFVLEERGGREMRLDVSTDGEPLTVWVEGIVVAYPRLYASLAVNAVLVGRWRDGVRAAQ